MFIINTFINKLVFSLLDSNKLLDAVLRVLVVLKPHGGVGFND